jgi:16S rRNA (adenine(1408)-N(1))-methyltransferase
METILGKQARSICAPELAQIALGYETVLLDLGTGDGRFVLHAARSHPRRLALGVDACRENLRASSRTAPGNALFVIANALALPPELERLAGELTINFPWGSLLDGLLYADGDLLAGLRRAARPGAELQVRLNASALAEAGWPLAAGGEQVRGVLAAAGLRVRKSLLLDAPALRAIPTTWARKMAAGRDPQAVVIRAQFR